MSDVPLFSEFEAVSSDQWIAQLEKALRGEPLSSLESTSPEGIQVKPFYRREDTLDLPHYPDLEMPVWSPGLILRGDQSVRDTMTRFAEEAGIHSRIEADSAFPVSLGKSNWLSYTRYLSDGESESSDCYDPFAHLQRTGTWNPQYWERTDALADQKKPVFWVDLDAYAEAGAHRIQELGYGMGHLTALFDRYAERFQSGAAPVFLMFTSLAGDFFFDIAKIRALRWLFSTVTRTYDVQAGCRILVRPGLRNKALYDYNNNLLRSALECASGIIGGADEVFNLPYDTWFKSPHVFSERLALNQLLVLKHEAYLDESSSLAEQVYYVDYLTSQMAEGALELLKRVQSEGGMLEALRAGTPQKDVLKSAETFQKRFESGDTVLLGSNYQINKEESLFDTVDTAYRDALLQPDRVDRYLKENPSQYSRLLPRRWAASWEAVRLNQESKSAIGT